MLTLASCPLLAHQERRRTEAAPERNTSHHLSHLPQVPKFRSPLRPLPPDEPSNTMSTTQRTTAAAAKTGEGHSTPSSPTATDTQWARGYRDYSTFLLEGNKLAEPKDNFPAKLHRILSDDANSHTIVWMVRQGAVVALLVINRNSILCDNQNQSTKASRPSLQGGP